MGGTRAEAGARVALGILVVGALASGCGMLRRRLGPPVELLAAAQIGRWRPTPRYKDAKPWTLTDGVFQGHGSWVGYVEPFDDFVLECDFLFDGAQGGIVIRGERDSLEPWASGYELDIDWARGGKQGHIHFPVLPKPYPGEALFEPGKWHTVRIEARGPRITVRLDGRKAIAFTDPRITRGHICLEGEAGGVKYRNLRVRRRATRGRAHRDATSRRDRSGSADIP